MPTLNLLYKDEYIINDKIKVVIPTVGEIIDDEDNYYSLVSIFTSQPIDQMVLLDDAGIDFTEINDYELFLLMFGGLQAVDTHLILGDIDFSKFEIMVNQQNNTLVLYDKEDDITIDRSIHNHIASALRKIHHMEKDVRKPGNKEAKRYMLERARKKMQRNKRRKQDSQLEQLIVAMVNTEQYKYDYETTREISIYQFNESVRQIIKKVDYDNVMHGVYAGMVDSKKLNPDDLNWLVHK